VTLLTLTHGSQYSDFRLNVNSSFLHLSTGEWETIEAYLLSAEIVKAVNVVNDAAECGVKLATYFIDATWCDEHFHNILQVVESDRKQNPNFESQKELNRTNAETD